MENTAKRKLAAFHDILQLSLSWGCATGFLCMEQMAYNKLNLVFLDVVTHLSFSMCDLETIVKQQGLRGYKQ